MALLRVSSDESRWIDWALMVMARKPSDEKIRLWGDDRSYFEFPIQLPSTSRCILQVQQDDDNLQEFTTELLWLLTKDAKELGPDVQLWQWRGLRTAPAKIMEASGLYDGPWNNYGDAEKATKGHKP